MSLCAGLSGVGLDVDSTKRVQHAGNRPTDQAKQFCVGPTKCLRVRGVLRGPYGVEHWNRQVERLLTEVTGEPIWSACYADQPVLVTATDYGVG
jgi:hypothetical protein